MNKKRRRRLPHQRARGGGEGNQRRTRQPLPGMVKRQCPVCRYFFAAPTDSEEPRCPDCLDKAPRARPRLDAPDHFLRRAAMEAQRTVPETRAARPSGRESQKEGLGNGCGLDRQGAGIVDILRGRRYSRNGEAAVRFDVDKADPGMLRSNRGGTKRLWLSYKNGLVSAMSSYVRAPETLEGFPRAIRAKRKTPGSAVACATAGKMTTGQFTSGTISTGELKNTIGSVAISGELIRSIVANSVQPATRVSHEQ